jgi:hypothetical protein
MSDNSPLQQDCSVPLSPKIMGTKSFKARLLLNYKTGEMRLFKREVRDPSPWEIPVLLSVVVDVPDYSDQVIEKKITLTKAQVSDMTLDSL